MDTETKTEVLNYGMRTSKELGEIYASLAKAQGEFKVAKKSAENPYFKSNYADLQDIVDACRLSLSKNNLSFTQVPVIVKDKMVLITRICHSSGQWFESDYPVTPVKLDPQSIGSAISYAKRYQLQAMLGVVSSEEDDDGEEATARGLTENEPANRTDVVKLLKAFEKYAVSGKEIFTYLSVEDSTKVTLGHISKLRAVYNELAKGTKKENYFGAH